MSDKELRSRLIRLAHEKPELRKEILPLVRENDKMAARNCPLAKNFEGLVGIGESFVNREVLEIRDEDYSIVAATGVSEAMTTLNQLRDEILRDPAGSKVQWLVEQLACNVFDTLIDIGRARKSIKLKQRR